MATENTVMAPKQFIGEIRSALPKLSAAERTNLFVHARAWAIVYYNGDVPEGTSAELKGLEDIWHFANK